MGYLDRAKALMKEAGIDCAKSVISAKSLPEIKPLAEHYRLKYPEGQVSQQELIEIATRVHGEGFVLLWSHVLGDFVAFYQDEEVRSKIPSGFVPYSEAELWELFGEGKPQPSQQTLKLIHEAKKQGGSVVDNEVIQ